MNLRTFHITVQWLIKPSGPQKTVTPVTFPIAMIIITCQSLYKDLGINCNTTFLVQKNVLLDYSTPKVLRYNLWGKHAST